MTLPSNSASRKGIPLYRGVLLYAPDALAGVAMQSVRGNAQHHPDADLHQDRGKSGDHGDALMRHLMDLGAAVATFEREDSAEIGSELDCALRANILAEADAIAWRALMLSQELHEAYGDQPLAPAARAAE